MFEKSALGSEPKISQLPQRNPYRAPTSGLWIVTSKQAYPHPLSSVDMKCGYADMAKKRNVDMECGYADMAKKRNVDMKMRICGYG